MASGLERYNWGANDARRVWSFALIDRSLFRALITSAVLAAGEISRPAANRIRLQ
jgi:hypothetical protein